MNASLKILQSQSGNKTIMKLVGQIDEDADYNGASFNNVTQIIFDFENVPLVNSTGLQKWISFLNTIPSKIKIYFEKCTPKIVKQIDMFSGFSGNRPVEIISFYAPYYCEKCSKASNILLAAKDVKNHSKAPEVLCTDCSNPMEFDAIEKKYFLFLNNLKSAS